MKVAVRTMSPLRRILVTRTPVKSRARTTKNIPKGTLHVQLDERTRQVEEQQKQLVSQRGQLEYAQLKIRVLEERLRKQRIERYGKRSETLSDLQLELLDLEQEPSPGPYRASRAKSRSSTIDFTTGPRSPIKQAYNLSHS